MSAPCFYPGDDPIRCIWMERQPVYVSGPKGVMKERPPFATREVLDSIQSRERSTPVVASKHHRRFRAYEHRRRLMDGPFHTPHPDVVEPTWGDDVANGVDLVQAPSTKPTAHQNGSEVVIVDVDVPNGLSGERPMVEFEGITFQMADEQSILAAEQDGTGVHMHPWLVKLIGAL